MKRSEVMINAATVYEGEAKALYYLGFVLREMTHNLKEVHDTFLRQGISEGLEKKDIVEIVNSAWEFAVKNNILEEVDELLSVTTTELNNYLNHWEYNRYDASLYLSSGTVQTYAIN